MHTRPALLLLMALLVGLLAPRARASEDHAPAGLSPDAVLQRLLTGNQHFAEGHPDHEHADPAWRRGLVSGQHPVATVLCCSDSRVPPELLFSQGFGDLFIVRLAGNVVDEDVEGSIEYGVLHAGTPLVMVLGHEKCGAVTAALDYREGEPRPIRELLQHILPVVVHAEACPPAERVQKAVVANVRQSVAELDEVPILRDRVREGRLKIVGAVYNLETGRVVLLDPASAPVEPPAGH